MITRNEVLDVEETNFNEKNIICKTQNFYILRDFLLTAIALLIGVSIYSYLQYLMLFTVFTVKILSQTIDT